MIRSITADDVRRAVSIAEEAFWASISQQFPEAKTGTVDISLSVQTTLQNERAVAGWIEMNIGPVTRD